ncbi:MAG: HAD family hydrolase [Clostridiales bacterium]|nr:HAD family hydrolase [Clostridiales bacterium]
MYRNYIFDLYGTLVDIHTDEYKDEVWQKLCFILEERGVRYRPEEPRDAYHAEVRRQEALLRKTLRDTGRTGEPEVEIGDVFRRMVSAKGVCLDGQEIAALARTFRTLSTEKLRLFDGAEELLRQLKGRGKGVYLLSNAQRLFTRPELSSLGLSGYFDGILLSSDAGVKKPDPRFYQMLLRQYRLRAEDCLMTGNDDLADCHGAAAVGMDSCYIRTEQSPVRQRPLPPNCREIHHILEVLALG